MITLKNEHLTISVNEHGAELSSIKSNGREYLWQADPTFWARHSPVLFPIVGNVYDKKFRAKGNEYNLGQHGFARDMDFTLVSQTDDEVWFALDSNEETLQKFPYAFHLEIGYRICGQTVDVMWRVTNPAEETLHFQIGAHPAFYWPEHNPAKAPRGFFAFDVIDKHQACCGCEKETSHTLTSRKLIGKGCVSPTETFVVELDEQDMLPLNVDTFDVIDTIILEKGQVSRVALCDVNRKPLLALSFQNPVVGLWSPPTKAAPFVCIEPWYGRCDSYGYDGEFKDREWVNHLQQGEKFEAKYTIEIC